MAGQARILDRNARRFRSRRSADGKLRHARGLRSFGMTTTTGRCLCGGVRFAVEGPLSGVQFCHCEDCRRAQGSAFAANMPVAVENFRLEAGEDLLAAFESSPGKERVFCRRCGSPVFSRSAKDPAHVRVRAGTLDAEARPPLAFHFWIEDDAAWWDAAADIPRYSRERP
jgi:hypothetical protein